MLGWILLFLVLLNLLFTILVYVNSMKEKFCNCSGIQHDGLKILENKDYPLCPSPNKAKFGCSTYDPEKVFTDVQ